LFVALVEWLLLLLFVVAFAVVVAVAVVAVSGDAPFGSRANAHARVVVVN